MNKRLLGCAAVALLLIALAAARPVAAAPPAGLANALSSLRALSDAQFERVAYWSRNGAARPFVASNPEQRVQAQILDLGTPNRNAVLAWLRGDGRSALYDRGASDADIGGRRPAAMTPGAPAPTPNPYRTVNFASATLGDRAQGQIHVLGGFAAVKRDGKAAIVCLSFKNVSSKVARRVDMEFPLMGAQGHKLGELEIDRRGEFSPGIEINGWPSLSDWQGGIGHRGYGDNCRFVGQGIASAPLLNVVTVTYRVIRVEYDDGSSWSPQAPY